MGSAVNEKSSEEHLSDRAIIVIIGNLVSGIGKILLPIILVRLITKADYGSYRQAMLFYVTFGTIFLFGVPQSIYYFIPQLSGDNQKRIVTQSFNILASLGLILTISFFLLSGLIARWLNNEMLSFYIKVFSPYFFFMLPAQAFIPLLISFNRHKDAAFASVGFMVVSLISVLLPLFLGYGLKGVFISMVCFACLQLVVVVLYTAKVLDGLPLKWSFNLFKKQLSYATPVGLSGVVGIISRTLDKYVISTAFTPDRFAIYAIGARELPLVNLLPYSVSNVLQPKLVERYHKGDLDSFMRLWHESIRKISFVMLPIFVFLFVLAQDFIVFLYTSEYVESVILFKIYLCILPLRVTAYGPILLATGRPKFVFRATFIGLVLNLCLSIILLYLIGFVGPAIATIIAQWFVIVLYLIKISRVVSVHFWKVFPFRDFLQIFGISAFCGCLVYPVTLIKTSPIMILLIAAVSFGVMYIILLKSLKILTKKDISILKRWITLSFLLKNPKHK